MTQQVPISSTAGAGLETVTYRIGPGRFRIHSACIVSTVAYAQTAKIYVAYEQGDGSTSDVHLGGGWVRPAEPFSVVNLTVQGPGDITGEVFNLEATGTFTFLVDAERI